MCVCFFFLVGLGLHRNYRMLSASVCGNIFASPNSQQISSAIRTLSDSRG
uniref:Uncharacterized protein n=1 Tax=Phakopsora pachyrhizi TaxID=170000 RepID=A0A0S1MJL4_PHAPC